MFCTPAKLDLGLRIAPHGKLELCATTSKDATMRNMFHLGSASPAKSMVSLAIEQSGNEELIRLVIYKESIACEWLSR